MIHIVGFMVVQVASGGATGDRTGESVTCIHLYLTCISYGGNILSPLASGFITFHLCPCWCESGKQWMYDSIRET